MRDDLYFFMLTIWSVGSGGSRHGGQGPLAMDWLQTDAQGLRRVPHTPAHASL